MASAAMHNSCQRSMTAAAFVPAPLVSETSLSSFECVGFRVEQGFVDPCGGSGRGGGLLDNGIGGRSKAAMVRSRLRLVRLLLRAFAGASAGALIPANLCCPPDWEASGWLRGGTDAPARTEPRDRAARAVAALGATAATPRRRLAYPPHCHALMTAASIHHFAALMRSNPTPSSRPPRFVGFSGDGSAKRTHRGFVTLFHWDSPQALEDKYEGFLVLISSVTEMTLRTMLRFLDSLVRGNYPLSMRGLVGNRLPQLIKEQSKLVKGAFDFIGLNYYTSYYADNLPPSIGLNNSYNTDSRANLTGVRNGIPIGPQAASPWLYVYPQGFRELLLYIKEKYDNTTIYITENVTGLSRRDNPPSQVVFLRPGNKVHHQSLDASPVTFCNSLLGTILPPIHFDNSVV
ncbi:hypothetical protein PR202_ga19967 [Eleusine coracana subsp. coracana]|uniref:Beta-glucosidase n=1 Tax=Eleusine coracana subsp. coracana TaxID=191504 RepID=A0AAV5CX03_ELECO|nr:hypothetical protein PR202_ga19967 [Eleusine coracana subsp. coracana]